MRKTPSHTEKKMVYSIRSLKNGTGSVLIGASLVLLAMATPTISSDESTPTTNEPNNRNTTTLAQPLTDTAAGSGKNESDISSPRNANASLEKTEEKPATEPTTSTSPVTTETKAEEPIEDNYFRIHVKKLPEENKDAQGLWTWDDVEKPSENWPNGALSFKDAKKDDYGYYLDVKLKGEQAKKISFLINNTAGKNLTGDKSVEKLVPKMNEAWLDQDYKVFSYEPQPAGTVRVNYYRTDGNYDKKSLWYWGDVKNPSSAQWPDGTDFTATGKYGRYIDIPLNEAAREFGFLLLDESKQGDDVKIRKENYKFTDLKNHSQIFLKDDDESIYTNPYYVHDIRMTGAQHVGTSSIESSFSTLVGAKKEDILKHSNITNHLGNKVTITDVAIDEAGKKVTYSGDFSDTKHPYTVSYNSDQFTTKTSWRLKDETYSYDGKLGADLKEEGKQVDLTLWSPSADKVSVVVYDKNDPDKVVGTVALEKGERGTWKQTLDSTNKLGITDFTGYYYQYQIERQGKTVLALDPYAKSLAAWNSDDAKIDDAHKVAKAAFVDPAKLGPQDLTYGKIHNFKTREDAVIYEAHVRDFTSDPAIAKDLTKPFGTFEAFIEKLDYLKDLGVTHIQLLPVLSYYFVNADEKAREFNLGTAFAHLRNAEVLADENQAGSVGIANPKGLEWTEKGLKLNALTATVLRVSQNGTSHESTAEEKPDSTPSKPEHQNEASHPAHQDPAPEARPDSTKPDAKVADAENKPSQATADSQAEQPAQEAQASSVKEAVRNESVENSSKENIPATPDKQAELPNTGIKNENKLLFAGISLLALLGLGFLLKNKKEN